MSRQRCIWQVLDVVPRKGHVDCEMSALATAARGSGSCPARGMWIEMQELAWLRTDRDTSCPARGTWIEIPVSPARTSWVRCRAPQGARGLKWRRACAAACSVKRHEDWNLVWIKEAEKRVEGRAEWRRLPAELSSCIVGTLSKILIQSVQGGVYHFSWVRSGSRQSYAPIWKRR